MTEAPEYKMMLRVKKSDFNNAPTLYLYSGEGTSAKEYNGAWPGTAMTEDGECTLKRYYKDKRRRKIRLHPENDDMEDMYFDNIEIQGIAVKVIKNLENV